VARIIQAAWLALAALVLSGCGIADDKAPDYRYRLTVEVDTPEGLRAGSSVIQVQQSLGGAASAGGLAGGQIYYEARGEAVAVDLPGGRTLFALLRSDDNIDWAAGVMQGLAPKSQGESWAESFDNVLLINGVVEVPRMWPANATLPERSAYPMLVTFGDVADPASVARVNPDDLAAIFGEGVTLKRITVALTDDPVTTGIEQRLGWMDAYRNRWFDGNRTIVEDLTTDDLTAHLTAGSFSTEFAK
jgi:hypothetical protein